MGIFKPEKTAEEIELEKQELEKDFFNFKAKYNLSNLDFEDFLLLQDKYRETKAVVQNKYNRIMESGGSVSADISTITSTFQNFYILEQLGKNQQQLEALNQKFDILIELLSKNKE